MKGPVIRGALTGAVSAFLLSLWSWWWKYPDFIWSNGIMSIVVSALLAGIYTWILTKVDTKGICIFFMVVISLYLVVSVLTVSGPEVPGLLQVSYFPTSARTFMIIITSTLLGGIIGWNEYKRLLV
jgi:hypothetical protein